jgi:hypothetical protein
MLERPLRLGPLERESPDRIAADIISISTGELMCRRQRWAEDGG